MCSRPRRPATPSRLSEFARREPEIGVVCAFGQLIREPLLSELELLNVHPSLLPRWRGAAPIERAIMAGDAETGVSIMRLTEGLDSGPVALQRAVSIDEDGFGALSRRLEELGGELLVDALERRAAGTLELTEQDDDGVTYAEKIEPAERRLDPHEEPAVQLARRVRALNPHVGTYLEVSDGERLGVVAARAASGQLGPGAVGGEGELRIGTPDGDLVVSEVRPAGGKAMTADAYLRGHELPQRLP